MSRYWEGVSYIKVMHSKWADAVLQILSFDRSHDPELRIEDEPFCQHVVHQFKQLSALATIHLHGEKVKKPKKKLSKQETQQSVKMGTVEEDPTLRLNKQIFDMDPHDSKGVVKALHDTFDEEELHFLDGQIDVVQAQITRILRSIISRHTAGGIRAPAPIVSRVFQELSNGVLAYNNACKIKEVPVPFALVNVRAARTPRALLEHVHATAWRGVCRSSSLPHGHVPSGMPICTT